ncbi:MAG: hypothetical protein JNG84_13675 [Archangium sp.]|nr:hypothetical protein [Archangium sp.]
MDIKVGDLVQIVRPPTTAEALSPAQQEIFSACVGWTLRVAAVDSDGTCVVRLDQEWAHFPEVTPFDLHFEPSCLRLLRPFSDEQWHFLSTSLNGDGVLSGTIDVVDEQLVVRLPYALLGELTWPEPVSMDKGKALSGTPIRVMIAMVNQTRGELVVAPLELPAEDDAEREE